MLPRAAEESGSLDSVRIESFCRLIFFRCLVRCPLSPLTGSRLSPTFSPSIQNPTSELADEALVGVAVFDKRKTNYM